MNPKEIESSGFSTSGDSIYQNNKLIGEFTEVEWELYNGELIQEISVELDELNVNIESLIKYLHTIAPRAKIEVSGNKFK